MTLILLSFLSKHRINLFKNKLIHLFLILVAMLISISANPQVISDTTKFLFSKNYGLLAVDFHDL